jgi:hypothetical protein
MSERPATETLNILLRTCLYRRLTTPYETGYKDAYLYACNNRHYRRLVTHYDTDFMNPYITPYLTGCRDARQYAKNIAYIDAK